MKNNKQFSYAGIYVISDCLNLSADDLLKKSEDIINFGVAFFQYRNKETNKSKRKELALKLQSICIKNSTPFIVNDDIELAKEINADGVHLGKNDDDIDNARNILGNKIIGVSCYNNISRACDAEYSGANYVAFGSCFPSKTKPDAKTIGIKLLREAKSKLTIPIVAIGGITPENGKQVIDTGIDLLAIISGLYSVPDTISAVKKYNNLFK